MGAFIQLIRESVISFINDDFDRYKNLFEIPLSHNNKVKMWLLNHIDKVTDEFLEEALQEVLDGFNNVSTEINGINFLYGGSHYSVFSFGGNFYFSSNTKINLKRIDKIIGNNE